MNTEVGNMKIKYYVLTLDPCGKPALYFATKDEILRNLFVDIEHLVPLRHGLTYDIVRASKNWKDIVKNYNGCRRTWIMTAPEARKFISNTQNETDYPCAHYLLWNSLADSAEFSEVKFLKSLHKGYMDYGFNLKRYVNSSKEND